MPDERLTRLRAEIDELVAQRRRCGDDVDPYGSAGVKQILDSLTRQIVRLEKELAAWTAAVVCPSLVVLLEDPAWTLRPDPVVGDARPDTHGWILERRIDALDGGWFEVSVTELSGGKAALVLSSLTSNSILDGVLSSLASACTLAARWAGNLAAGRSWAERPVRMRPYPYSDRLLSPPGPRLQVLLRPAGFTAVLDEFYGPVLRRWSETLRVMPADRLHLPLTGIHTPAAELAPSWRATVAQVAAEVLTAAAMEPVAEARVEEAFVGRDSVYCGLCGPGVTAIVDLAATLADRLREALPAAEITLPTKFPRILLAYGIRDIDVTDLKTQIRDAVPEDLPDPIPTIGRLGTPAMVLADLDPVRPDLWQ